MKEIARQHGHGRRAQGLTPRRTCALRRGRYPQPPQDPPHRGCPDPAAQGGQLALDLFMAPARVLPRHLLDQRRAVAPQDRNQTLTALARAEPVTGAQHPTVQRRRPWTVRRGCSLRRYISGHQTAGQSSEFPPLEPSSRTLMRWPLAAFSSVTEPRPPPTLAGALDVALIVLCPPASWAGRSGSQTRALTSGAPMTRCVEAIYARALQLPAKMQARSERHSQSYLVTVPRG
jgi:hypothetical protein